jgi:hypothetical protein
MYTFVLYLHFVALALAFFATGLAVAGGLALKRAASVGDGRFALRISTLAGKLHPLSALGLLLTGGYLTQSQWSWTTPWILCGVVGLVIVAILGGGVMGGRERAMDHALREAPEGPILAPLRQRLNDPVIAVCGPAITLFVLGIMYLMVMKPALTGSVLTLVIAAVVGVALGASSLSSRGAKAPSLRNAEQSAD